MINPPFDQLHLKKQSRFRLKPKKSIKTIGYDTETAKGQAHLISDSLGRHCHPTSLDDILHFLCCKETRHHIGFWFNLKYDFQAILKWLDPESWYTILKKGEIDYQSDLGKYKIIYIPRKMLSIKKGKKRKWVFYDISQFFRGTLDNVGNQYLGMRKLKHTYDLSNLQIHHFREHEMMSYCQRDAVMTVMLADYWIKICKGSGLHANNFCSPASIASQFFRERVKIPTINKFILPEFQQYLKLAYNCVSGAFISAYKRGYIPKVYEYDINSSYPSRMAKLPDISHGKFYDIDGTPPDDALLGWMEVLIEISPKHEGFFHPCLPVMRKKLPNYYPVGIFKHYITLEEYTSLSRYYKIKPIKGLYFKDKHPRYLFKDIIESSYKKRKATTDKNINVFLKTILNGIYGKNLEKIQIVDEEAEHFGKWRIGQLFNPFYASYILGGSRLQVFEGMLKTDPSNLVACATDSIFSEVELDLPLSDKLGAWGFVQEGEMLMMGSGVYSVRNKQATKSMLRGFTKKFVKKGEVDKNSLFYLIPKCLDKKSITVDITENVSPLTAIIQKRPEEMNFIIKKTRDINLNFDTKRLWDYSFKRVGDLLDKQSHSQPLIHLE